MPLEFRKTVKADYPDVFTADALRALDALAPLDARRKSLPPARIHPRADRATGRNPSSFFTPSAPPGSTSITARAAPVGRWRGAGTQAGQWRRGWAFAAM